MYCLFIRSLLLMSIFLSGYTTFVVAEDNYSIAELQMLAEKGNSGAQYMLGHMYDEGHNGLPKDSKKAILWYTKAAKSGFIAAQSMLGLIYETGIGAPKDYKQAVYWYTKAAKQGDRMAQDSLGLMYREGLGGLPQDDKQAVFWFRKAAEQGDMNALNRLGFMYQLGRGVPCNLELACMYYCLAARAGDAIGLNNYNSMAKALSPEQLLNVQALLSRWRIGKPLPTY